MRAVSEMLPGLGSTKTHYSSKRRYGRPVLVALLLLALYLLLRWVPLDAVESTGGPRLDALLLWCLGGLVTLGCLAIAGRRS